MRSVESQDVYLLETETKEVNEGKQAKDAKQAMEAKDGEEVQEAKQRSAAREGKQEKEPEEGNQTKCCGLCAHGEDIDNLIFRNVVVIVVRGKNVFDAIFGTKRCKTQHYQASP